MAVILHGVSGETVTSDGVFCTIDGFEGKWVRTDALVQCHKERNMK